VEGRGQTGERQYTQEMGESSPWRKAFETSRDDSEEGGRATVIHLARQKIQSNRKGTTKGKALYNLGGDGIKKCGNKKTTVFRSEDIASGIRSRASRIMEMGTTQRAM